MRALNLVVGLSMLATGLLGALASREVLPQEAVSVVEASGASPGMRLSVRGMLERVRPVGNGAAVAGVTDCQGHRLPVFFPRAPQDAPSFAIVVLEGVIKEYNGALEIVVDRPGDVRAASEGAAMLGADDLAAAPRERLCTDVAFTARIGWARVSTSDARDVEVGIPTGRGELLVAVHLDAFAVLTVEPGASVSFVGVLALTAGGERAVVHVRA